LVPYIIFSNFSAGIYQFVIKILYFGIAGRFKRQFRQLKKLECSQISQIYKSFEKIIYGTKIFYKTPDPPKNRRQSKITSVNLQIFSPFKKPGK